MNTRVLLMAESKVFGECCRIGSAAQPPIEVIASPGGWKEAVAQIRTLSLQFVLIDMDRPTMNGVDACHNILDETSGAKVLALSDSSEPQKMVEAFRAGVRGYLLKQTLANDLADAVRAVAEGRIHLSSVAADYF